MKRETAVEKFLSMRADSRRFVKEGREGIVLYLSGTKNMRTKLERLVQNFKKDADIDFEIGVINEEEYEAENKVYEIMVNSLRCYKVF